MIDSGIGYGFSNKLTGESKKDMRYLAIRQAPKFYLALIYDKTIDETKINKLAELIKSFIWKPIRSGRAAPDFLIY